MKLYASIPSPEKLLETYPSLEGQSLKVNGHFHTPYSFSAFSDLEQVLKMADAEKVDILGINDFYTTAGYSEFEELCLQYKKFPLFNIEFMGLLKREQEQGIRVNDPNNPGRTYFSGKGLDFPLTLKGTHLEQLQSVRRESDKQTRDMVEKADAHLNAVVPGLHLDYEEVMEKYTRGMVRERHIAKAIRELVFKKECDSEQRRALLEKIYGGKSCKADINDPVSLEGEIRSMLLKSGGAAFVKEDPRAFLEIPQVIEIILHAGGIPCYPVLLDDKNGTYTEYEADYQSLYENLTELNVHSLELIPGRNHIDNLRRFVKFFDEKGFVITFGTEHNTPALDPLTVSAGGNTPLDKYLLDVSFRGAAVTAAHQYLRAKGKEGFTNISGVPTGERAAFEKLGNAVIRSFIKS